MQILRDYQTYSIPASYILKAKTKLQLYLQCKRSSLGRFNIITSIVVVAPYQKFTRKVPV